MDHKEACLYYRNRKTKETTEEFLARGGKITNLGCYETNDGYITFKEVNEREFHRRNAIKG